MNKALFLRRQKHIDNLPYHLPSFMKEQVKRSVEKVILGGFDRVILITGREGSGKSKLGKQLAYAHDPTFNLDRTFFHSEDLDKGIKGADKFQAFVFDEAFNGLSSKGALSKENKNIVRTLIECRQKRLFIFIILPSIFLLEKYIGIFRSHVLFNVMVSKKDYNVRFYKVYNYQKKKELYVKGLKYLSYSYPKIYKSYRFYGKNPPTVDEAEYEKRKLKAFQERKDKSINITMLERNFAWWILKRRHKMKFTSIANEYNKVGLKGNGDFIGRIVRELDKSILSSNPIY